MKNFSSILFALSFFWKTSYGSYLPLRLFPAGGKDLVGLVEQYGYTAEEHKLTTPDGYNLRIHRIPGSPLSPVASAKPVVFLQHGMLCSSDFFAFVGPQSGLAYQLADRGYDVWLGNVRGNRYGRSHVTLSPDHGEQFWKFSFHEMGTIDVRASIDYVLNKTNQPSLIYIGHSLGTTMSYVLLSSYPEYNEKLRVVVSLAPSVFWRYRVPLWLQFLVNNHKSLTALSNKLDIYEVFPRSILNTFLQHVCYKRSPFLPLCEFFYLQYSGKHSEQLNTTLLSTFLYYTPAGTSWQLFQHFVQLELSGEFQPFDYGKVKNLLLYNQVEPPKYKLSLISAPTVIFYSDGDDVCPVENLPDLFQRLPNIVVNEKVSDENFGHLDFVLGLNVNEVVNDRLLQILTDMDL